jgi:hypothetical protein
MTDTVVKLLSLITMFSLLIWMTLASVSCAIVAGTELVELVAK